MDIAFLIVRCIIGLGMAAHGSQKLFGIFGGHGIAGTGGWEMAALYIAGALAVAFAGSGAYSLDRLFGLDFLTEPRQVWYALAAAVVLAALNLLARRPAIPSIAA